MKSLIITLLFTLFAVNSHAQQTEQSTENIRNLEDLDVHPKFPKGSFQTEVFKYLVIPTIDKDVSVKVLVHFVIEKDGTISNIKCENDPGYGFCLAVEKAVKAVTTRWKPGYSKGSPVRVKYVLPISISIKSPEQDKLNN